MMKKACDHRQGLLMDIQKVDFMLYDLNEFLDTPSHLSGSSPGTLGIWCVSPKNSRCSYEKQYGPLMAMTWDSSESRMAMDSESMALGRNSEFQEVKLSYVVLR